jgi:hypothetical protein
MTINVPTIVCLLAVLECACSGGHLTRSAAKAQIDKSAYSYLATHGGKDILINTGIVSGCEVGHGYDPVQGNATYAALKSTGYLTFTPINIGVWKVELTDLGEQAKAGDKYGATKKGDCDMWQVTIPVAVFDHFEVTGIVEEGSVAKVEVTATYKVTPVVVALKKYASENNADMSDVFGDELKYRSDKYHKISTVVFEKYDDGWRMKKLG